jgi:hypothetical protein
MFAKATRMKLRFNYKGLCTIEDLWDLNVKALDQIYKNLNSLMKEQKEESLLTEQTNEDKILALKLDIVKYIFKTKQDEAKERENYALKSAQKQKILKVISEKKDKELYDMPVEELEKLVNDL